MPDDAVQLHGSSTRWAIDGDAASGPVRRLSEDRWFRAPLPDGGCLVGVLDGLGASDTSEREVDAAVSAMIDRASDPCALTDLPDRLFRAAEAAIAHSLARRGGTGSVATVALLAMRGSNGVVAWVGDCRVMRFRDRAVARLTVDHTLAEAHFAAGRALPPAFPHVCLRFLGAENSAPGLVSIALEPGDRFALLTDGVWGALGDPQIAELVSGTLRGSAGRLTRAAFLAQPSGATDNAAAVVVVVS